MLYPPQNTLSTAHNGQHPTHILPDSTISPKDYVPGTFYTVRKLLRKAARKTENTELCLPGKNRHRRPEQNIPQVSTNPRNSLLPQSRSQPREQAS